MTDEAKTTLDNVVCVFRYKIPSIEWKRIERPEIICDKGRKADIFGNSEKERMKEWEKVNVA